MSESVPGVRSRTFQGFSIHRPSSAGDRTLPSCGVGNRYDPEKWIEIDVTPEVLQFKELCSRCYPAASGLYSCQQCGADLDRRRTTIAAGRYRVEFGCSGCGVDGALLIDPASAATEREGLAFTEPTGTRRHASDGSKIP